MSLDPLEGAELEDRLFGNLRIIAPLKIRERLSLQEPGELELALDQF